MIRRRWIERCSKVQLIRYRCFAVPCCQEDADYQLVIERSSPRRKRSQRREFPLCRRHALDYARKYKLSMPAEAATV